MKKILLFIVYLAIQSSSFAQTDPTWGYINKAGADSLRTAIKRETKDTLNMAAFRKLGFYYQESIPDSAFFFHEEQLRLAKKLKLKMWEADAYSQGGYSLTLMFNPIKGYEYFEAAEQLAKEEKNEGSNWRPWTFSNAENLHNSRIAILGMNYQMKGNIWSFFNDSIRQQQDYQRGAALGESIRNGKIMFTSYASISKLYSADSSIIFLKKALQAALDDMYPVVGWGYMQLAFNYASKGQIDSAFYFAQKGKEASEASNDNRTLSAYYEGLSGYYSVAGKLDSSLFAARKSYSTLADMSATSFELAPKYESLAVAYELNQMPDSAAFYWKKTYLLSESFRLKQLQYFSKYQKQALNEQLREKKAEEERTAYATRLKMIGLLIIVAAILFVVFIQYRNNRQKQQANKILEDTLSNLKATQAQLIQSEKMASLGELTAGIAHEIQNPLNFVNNFSEVSRELMQELKTDRDRLQPDEQEEILNDIDSNLEKINHHGKRADAIVKGMLQHSGKNEGEKELTDINALCDEYLRLSYHGLRAKDKTFNATLETDFDPGIEKINIVPQEIGRVIMNLLTNAFYAVSEKARHATINPQPGTYNPSVFISTKKRDTAVEIRVADNGDGIPANIIDKIFNPFFTTKPTGQGTGLGLSLSYDIVKAHGGNIQVKAEEGQGSAFTITLPIIAS